MPVDSELEWLRWMAAKVGYVVRMTRRRVWWSVCVLACLASLRIFLLEGKYGSREDRPFFYVSHTPDWSRRGAYWYAFVVDRIYMPVIGVSGCAGVQSSCNEPLDLQKHFEPAVRLKNINNVTVAFRKACPSDVDKSVSEMVESIRWRQAPPPARLPPNRWSDEKTRLFHAMLKKAVNIFESLGVEHVVHSGALIGIFRHGSLIPWDLKDIDIYIILGFGQKRQIVEAFVAAGFRMECAWGGVMIQASFQKCDNEPRLELWMAFKIPFQPFLWAHNHPHMGKLPIRVIRPLRLTNVFTSDGEPTVMFRPASDGLLDCLEEYSVLLPSNGSLVEHSWRDICYDTQMQTCSTMDNMPFLRSTDVTLSAFMETYAPHSLDRVLQHSSRLSPDTIVHASWQEFENRVVRFALDFAIDDNCAVLLEAPLQTPTPVEMREFRGFYSWERLPHFQC
eukprot:TRINITY_DN3721_c0_g1_i8.p1 TRINITY_DN3721_c0_g1~~TRINITY_DN3721_c0_g1_i8.p1  ORF type:complete len:474 (+),score=43.51 TRINITY_DN3721_c0_g1_i8:77-1423(+)